MEQNITIEKELTVKPDDNLKDWVKYGYDQFSAAFLNFKGIKLQNVNNIIRPILAYRDDNIIIENNGYSTVLYALKRGYIDYNTAANLTRFRIMHNMTSHWDTIPDSVLWFNNTKSYEAADLLIKNGIELSTVTHKITVNYIDGSSAVIPIGILFSHGLVSMKDVLKASRTSKDTEIEHKQKLIIKL